MRICGNCSQEKELENFPRNGCKKGGRANTCKACMNIFLTRDKDRKNDLGRCTYCSKLKLHNSRLCLFHWCLGLVTGQSNQKKQNFSLKQRIKRTNQLLGKLSNQNFKCFYTGLPLVPGLNASLEHFEPFSKSNNDTVSNIVWADITFNKIKGSGKEENAQQKFKLFLDLVKTNEYPVYKGA